MFQKRSQETSKQRRIREQEKNKKVRTNSRGAVYTTYKFPPEMSVDGYYLT